MLAGALAAAVTPLRDSASRLHEDAFEPLCELLRGGGLQGLLALGTTGEGILLSVEERKRAAELFVEAGQPLQVAVHCGAQTTADTVALAEHAAEIGAAAVVVIGPPYFHYDDEALAAHFASAARACDPLPFYVYEFAARSGYAVPVAVVERLRERAPNLRGLKVSDWPWEEVEPYLGRELDVFVGFEEFISRGMAAGAVGAVSGLATAFPELVAGAVETRSEEASRRLGRIRYAVQRFPFHAAVKRAIARRGVPIREDVRGPLRGLGERERAELDRWLESEGLV
jgi:dihydrodipicolinate synthase/N-acetylneuraminate lyase